MFKNKKQYDNRPIIVVTGPDRLLKFGWWATRFQLRRVGLRGVYLSPSSEEMPTNIDGIIIGGGDDIDPTHYGMLGSGAANYDKERDALELKTIRLALNNGLPVLGICRGAQLINVALGGTLISDLRPLRRLTPNKNTIFPVKQARITPDTKLNKIFDELSIRINSLHNQAVDDVGDGLIIAAKDDDGFVQAIESADDRFIIGVQWHPEYMPQKRSQTKLFNALANKVRQP